MSAAALNPRLLADLSLYLAEERLRRKIAASSGFLVAPSFRGEGGRPLYLDEMGYTDDAAAATLKNAAFAALERSLGERRKLLKTLYDIERADLDALVEERLGREVGAEVLPQTRAADAGGAA